METTRDHLVVLYDSYSDEEVVRLVRSGNLTELALSVAKSELRHRRIILDGGANDFADPPDDLALQVKMTEVAQAGLIEAKLLVGVLQSTGIDTDALRADEFSMSSPFPSVPAKVAIRVNAQQADDALKLIEAYRAGQFEVDEDWFREEFGEDAGQELADSQAGSFNSGYAHNARPQKMAGKRTQSEPYKTNESYWPGLFIIIVILTLLGIAYQRLVV
ncbi:hypothetical protein LG201_01805 [Methylobacillus gramineus]|uniref:hypothetical protein n=1 Tax=Methylobacillus gramineus TaxID=755169 RepID=UPI001CFF8ED3|nr:hypothetical protein [Methylobacillus gramineus]MCB5183937.1 hypothetical protein [Methylobacillus gramineus]